MRFFDFLYHDLLFELYPMIIVASLEKGKGLKKLQSIKNKYHSIHI